MTFDDAYEVFSKWYEDCLESGIDPNEVVQKIGEMYLLTDNNIIDFSLTDSNSSLFNAKCDSSVLDANIYISSQDGLSDEKIFTKIKIAKKINYFKIDRIH
jgi:hypothetical protein